jgi:hypothetical protein
MDDEEPSFFELLGRDPDLDDGVVLAPRRTSLGEVDGEYLEESDFVRLESLEGKPPKKPFLPKLALAPAVNTEVATPAPAAPTPVAAAVPDEGEAPGVELSLPELLQEDFERRRIESARVAETVKEEPPRLSLTARIRGRSASTSAYHESEIVQPPATSAVGAPQPVAKTRGTRSRTISEVVSDILRPHSRDHEAVAAPARAPDEPTLDAIGGGNDGEPMAFADFLGQDQDEQQQQPQLLPERPVKRTSIVTRARNASISGRRKSPLAGARSSTDAGARTIRKSGSTTMLKLTSSTLNPAEVARLVHDLDVALAMYDYAREALCEENVEAMMLIHEFRLAPTEYLRRRTADVIVGRFLAKIAPRPINIDARSREGALAEMARLKEGKAVPTTMFDGVMEQLSLLTHTDMMQRFVASPQCRLLREGLQLRARLELPELAGMEEQVRGMCSLRHWHQTDPADDGIELWDPDAGATGKGGPLAAGACRGSVRVAANAETVMGVLMNPAAYGEWLTPLLVKSSLERSFGSFFQVAELQVALDAQHRRVLHLGVLRVASTLADQCLLVITVPPERAAGLKAPKVLEVAHAGFVITPEDETSCRVVLTWAFKPTKKAGVGLAKTVVAQLLSKLRARDFTVQPDKELPDELAL